MKEIIKNFNREVKSLLITNFFLSSGSSLFFLLYNLYLKDIGFPEGKIGIIIAIRIFSSSAFLLLSHFINFNLIMLLKFLPFIFSISIILQGVLSPSLSFIIPGAILMGLSWGMLGFTYPPLLARKTDKALRPYAFSFNFSLSLLSGIIGNLGGGFFKKFLENFFSLKTSYNITFLTGAVIVLFSLIFLKCIKSEEAIEEAVNEEKEKKDTKLGFLILIPQILIGFGAGLFVPYMNLYFRNLFKLGADKIGIIFSITSFVMFISALTAPFLTRIMKKIKVLILTQGLSIPFMIILALSGKVYLSAISHIIRTSLMNMAQPLLSNVSMESVSMQYQKILNASITLSWNLSFALSNLLGGYLIQTEGFTLPILISTILYTVSTIFYMFLSKKEPFKNI